MDGEEVVSYQGPTSFHEGEERIYNTVKVDGAVKYPGTYELKPMMRLSQLLPVERTLPESYLDQVEIARRRPDFSVQVLAVNLRKAWGGDLDQDPLLKAEDEITVRVVADAQGLLPYRAQIVGRIRMTGKVLPLMAVPLRTEAEIVLNFRYPSA